MLRKFLAYLLIISLLLPALPVQAEGIYKMVGSGSVTQQNMRISAVAGTAFIDFSDSEAAANKLIDHKGYLLKIRDSSKRAIQGYVKAAGTGETLDVELLADPGFDDNTKWDKGAGWTVAGTAVHDGATGITILETKAISLGTKALYKLTATHTVNDGSTLLLNNDVSTGEFSTTGTKTLYGTGARIDRDLVDIYGYQNVTITDASVKQVLTPSATGVTIAATKTLAGTSAGAESFAALDSAFNYNDASGYTYELWAVNSAVEVASGSIAANEMLADTTATNAFVAPVGVDLSAYQTGKYIFAAYNTVGGYAAFGYIMGTAPGGLTLGAEKWDDTGFAGGGSWVEASGWTLGGVATHATGLQGGLYQTGKPNVIDGLFKVAVSVAAITSGHLKFDVGGAALAIFSTSTPVGDYSGYFTSKNTTNGFYALSSDVLSIDNASLKQVTDCAATGALIVSAKDGATRAWAYKHASFNPNIASTWKCFYVGD